VRYNKWVRRFHRWLAIPFIAVIVLLLILRQTEVGGVLVGVQQALVFVMALTGGYLLLLPYVVRRKQAARRASGTEATHAEIRKGVV
jgi:hypothetical protein